MSRAKRLAVTKPIANHRAPERRSKAARVTYYLREDVSGEIPLREDPSVSGDVCSESFTPNIQDLKLAHSISHAVEDVSSGSSHQRG
eukprot:1251965-Pyramimonas_sp.AAC.1